MITDTSPYDIECMKEAISLASKSIDSNGGPFGAIVSFNGIIVSRAANTVTIDIDPTAHAEINAIRNAAKALKSFDLSGCILYTSCEPCPMCLSAIYWARINKVFYAATRIDAHDAGFDDHIIYQELDLPILERKIVFKHILRDKSLSVFKKWQDKIDKIIY